MNLKLHVVKGLILVEQSIQVKCYVCGRAAKHVFAYARFNTREEFLGVIYRGVCKSCLNDYIESIKEGVRDSEKGLVWLAVFLPTGALLTTFAKSASWQIAGYGLIALALVLPIAAYISFRREAVSAQNAGAEENEAKYCPKMCRDDALHTSHQTKLVSLKPQYIDEEYTPSRISEETGVTLQTAEMVKTLTQKALDCIDCGESAQHAII